eukprot:5616955-Prymnesium_polylepis.1
MHTPSTCARLRAPRPSNDPIPLASPCAPPACRYRPHPPIDPHRSAGRPYRRCRSAPFCPRFGLEKAEYVLAVLEDVAQSVNERGEPPPPPQLKPSPAARLEARPFVHVAGRYPSADIRTVGRLHWRPLHLRSDLHRGAFARLLQADRRFSHPALDSAAARE